MTVQFLALNGWGRRNAKGTLWIGFCREVQSGGEFGCKFWFRTHHHSHVYLLWWPQHRYEHVGRFQWTFSFLLCFFVLSWNFVLQPPRCLTFSCTLYRTCSAHWLPLGLSLISGLLSSRWCSIRKHRKQWCCWATDFLASWLHSFIRDEHINIC